MNTVNIATLLMVFTGALIRNLLEHTRNSSLGGGLRLNRTLPEQDMQHSITIFIKTYLLPLSTQNAQSFEVEGFIEIHGGKNASEAHRRSDDPVTTSYKNEKSSNLLTI
jgi:hypothetical protein